MTLHSFFLALLFAALGMSVFAGGLVVIGKLLPGQVWDKAIKENSISAAIVLAAVALALGWIVAAAVH